MAKYAVIKLQGHQYRITEGQEIVVDKIIGGKPEAEVLMVVDGDKVTLGKPLVDKAKVTFKVLAELEKGEKVDIRKYKSKSRYRRHVGFRPKYTRLLVDKITV